MRSISTALMVSTCIASITFVPCAWAADTTNVGAPTDVETVVVTGTLIKGESPVGAEVITIDQDQIQALGAIEPDDILNSLPQTSGGSLQGGFGTVPGVHGNTGLGTSTVEPALHGVGESDGGPGSLLLVDGHRLPGMGITTNGPDVDTLPVNALQRVEVLTDGGSATYGSDAVGGVINYITRARYDGLQVGGSVGLTATGYTKTDENLLLGKDWGWGSAYVAYDHSQNTDAMGFDFKYDRGNQWQETVALGHPVGGDINCSPGNVSVTPETFVPFPPFLIPGNTSIYGLPGLTTTPLPTPINGVGSIGNTCDSQRRISLFPSEDRHAAFGKLTIDDGGPVTGSISVFYNHRQQISNSGPLTPQGGNGGISVPSTSASFIPIPGLFPPPASETLNFNLASVYGNNSYQISELESYGITPQVTVKFLGDWEATVMASYGYGGSSYLSPGANGGFNAAPVQAAANAGTFDFANLNDPENAAVLKSATDFYDFGLGTNKLFNTRLVADGSLYSLPGGEVKIAFGTEYSRETYTLVQASGDNSVTKEAIGSLAQVGAARNVLAGFVELNVPIISPEMHFLINSMSLDLAGRRDDYSDFGHTTNPRVGVDVKPVDWVQLHAKWSTEFQAPSLNTLAEAGSPSFIQIPSFALPLVASIFEPPGGLAPLSPLQSEYIVMGTILPLKPQKATTWQAGFDVQPPFIEGADVGATWYSIKYTQLIGPPGGGLGATFWEGFPSDYVLFTQGNAAVTSFLQKLEAGNPKIASGLNQIATMCSPLPITQCIYALLEDETQNIGTEWIQGFDIHAAWNHDTDFGTVFASLNGNLPTIQNGAEAGAPPTNAGSTTGLRFSSATTAGATIGDFLVQGTWNRAPGYKIAPSPAALEQANAKTFNVFNLFFRYRFPDQTGWKSGTDLTLNVDNIFDTNPSTSYGNGDSIATNGQTLGRMFTVGIKKAF